MMTPDAAPLAPTLGHTVLIVPDIERALPFWEDGLGFAIKSRETDYVELQDGEGRVFALVTPACMQTFTGHLPVCLPAQAGVWQNTCFSSIRVSDVEAVVKRLIEFGAVVMSPPTLMPWGSRIAFIQDVYSGFCFELTQRKAHVS